MDLDLETILLFEQHGSVCGCPEFWGTAPWTSVSTCPTVDIQDVWKSQLQSSSTNGVKQVECSPSSKLTRVNSEISPSTTTKTSSENKGLPGLTTHTPTGTPEFEEALSFPTGPPKETCIFWYHGKCQRGQQCNFTHESHVTWPISTPPGYIHNFPCKLPLCPLRVGMAELVSSMVARAENADYGSHGDADIQEIECVLGNGNEANLEETCFFWYHDNCRRGDQCHLAHEIIGAKHVYPPPGYSIHEHECELPLCSINQDTDLTGDDIVRRIPQYENMSTDGDENGSNSDSESSSDSNSHAGGTNHSNCSGSGLESGSESAEDKVRESAFDAINNMFSRSPSTNSGWTTTTFSSRQSFTPEPLQPLSSQREEIDEGVSEEDEEGEITQTCHSDNSKQRAPLPPQNFSARQTKLIFSTSPTINQIPSVLRQAPRAPKARSSNRVQLCFFWYHTGRCSRHQEKTCRFWHQPNFLGTPISKVALPPNVSSMRHDPDCQLPHCPLRMLRRKLEVEYYEDMNQDLVRENMEMEEAARQSRIKIEAQTDDSFDFTSVPTGPKAERGSQDRTHPSMQHNQTEVKSEQTGKDKSVDAKKQVAQQQKRKAGRSGRGKAKAGRGARVGPGGGVQKPKKNRKSKRWRNARDAWRLEALAAEDTKHDGMTEGLNVLDSVKPKLRPVRENPNLIPLGPKRKEISPLQGLRGAKLAEMERLGPGDQSPKLMGNAEAQPWFLTGFPDGEGAAPQAKGLVNYALPNDNERAEWDTDFLRKAFGEIP